MGNLGQYQMITTISKKVHGPVNLLIITALAGYGVFRGVESITKSLYKRASKNLSEYNKIYTVKARAVVGDESYGNRAITLVKDDQFKVLFRDGDVVMIEKLGGGDNPYIESAAFLSTISDYSV